jgi:hypothetical protein
VDIWDKAGMDIAGMDRFGKSGIAANMTGNASLPARNTGHAAADTTGYAFPPARNMDHTVPKTTQFHPKIGRNNREHILVPVHHGCLKPTNIKA